jgi:hypothetical protein
MTPEVKEKLKKVYALVNGGATEGERAAAQKALDKILEKYNINAADLESIDKDWHLLTYTTEMEWMLIFRLARTVISKPDFSSVPGKKRLGVLVTYFDWVTLSSAYEYFRRHMKAQWVKFCAPHVARCRTTKTRNAKRKQLQEIFFGKYVIASNLYQPEELTTVDLNKVSKQEREARMRLDGVEGGKYTTQVTNGLYLGNGLLLD